jgi:hypothetical protein
MKQQLLDYVDENKIQVVSIWPGSGDFKPIQKEGNKFLLEKKWMNKFIVLYSGNLGIGHKLEVLIEAAEGLRDIDEILFLFIGEGSKKKKTPRLSYSKTTEQRGIFDLAGCLSFTLFVSIRGLSSSSIRTRGYARKCSKQNIQLYGRWSSPLGNRKSRFGIGILDR